MTDKPPSRTETEEITIMIRYWAKSQGLTAYEIGDRTEGSRKQRWQRWLGGEGLKTLQTMQDDLEALGFKLAIVKK